MAATLFPELLRLIASYLDVPSLVFWRAVGRAHFQDVENTVEEFMTKRQLTLPHCLSVRIPLTPWQSSLWFHFMVNFYKCTHCETYISNPDYGLLPESEAEEHQLCLPCFTTMLKLVPCASCVVYFNVESCVECYDCGRFWCSTCKQDQIRSCMTCTNLFCDSCSIDDWCDVCQ